MGDDRHDDEEEREQEHEQMEGFSPTEYEDMLLLERLESLEEDMLELGVATLTEVRRRIEELHHKLDEEP
jgi:hypothetical protein